jgi:hypothetical protein
LWANYSKVCAETEVFEGDILEDTVWDKNGSPYLIYDSINVAPGVTFTINPGVIVKFDIWHSFRVFGNLVINGSVDDKVYLTSLYDDNIGGDLNNDNGQYEPDYDDWEGIFSLPNSSYSIKNAEIHYAECVLSSNASFGVIDSTFFNHSYHGFSFSNGSKSEIKNSQIYDVLGGPKYGDGVLFSVWNNCNVLLDNVTAENVPYASTAVSYGGSSLKVLNSKFSNIRGGFDSHTNSTLSISNSIMKNLQSKIRAIFPARFGSSMDISSSTIEGVYDNSKYQSIFQVSNGSHLTFTDSSLKNITGKDCSIGFEAFGGDMGYSTSTLEIKNSSISDGDCTGLEISGNTETNISNTKIKNFAEEGLSAFLSPKISIADSEIADNNSGIISLGADLEIKNSNISNNDVFGIYNNSLEKNSTIEAIGNWWGDKTGPYNDLLNASGTANKVSLNVNFTPWLKYNPIVGEKKNPVIIIPGILSSYLNKNDYTNEEVWMNLVKAIMSLSDDYLDDLMLNQFGKIDMTKTQTVPTDILRKVKFADLFERDFFDGLIKSLESDGYIENKDLFVFPYDWRLDIRDSVNNTPSPLVMSLKSKIEQILAATGSEKIDVIAHSMGGLLSKYYLKNFGQGKVDKFIDIATPNFGAPSAFGTLISGDNLGIKLGPLGLSTSKVKKIIQNMPSAYQLLPSQSYVSDSLPDYKYYVDDLEDYDNNDVRGRLSIEESNEFLKNTGRNSYVLDNSVGVHDDIDNMNPADYGAEVYNIVGCGIPTIGKFFTLGKQNNENPEFDIAYISGDGTVPQRSAEGIFSNKQYYVTGFEHPMIPSSEGVKNLIPLILSGRQDSFNFDSYKSISTTTNGCGLPNGSFLSFHNPIDVNIYDEFGNHTGPNTDGNLEETISSIVYNIIENSKFVYLPDDQNYKIILQANTLGSFDSYIKKIENGVVVSTSYFNDIPLMSTSTKAEIKMKNSVPEIVIDDNGDGTDGEFIQPSSVITGDSLEDREMPVTELKVVSQTPSIDGAYVGDIVISFNATDIGSGLLKTEYSINNSDYLEATSTIKIIDSGEVRIIYRSIDKAGNIEDPKEVVFNIKNKSKLPHGRRSLRKSDLETVEILASTTISTSTQIVEPALLAVDKSETNDKNISDLNIVSNIVQKPITVSTKSPMLTKKEKTPTKARILSQELKIKVDNFSLVKNNQVATVILHSQVSKKTFFTDFFRKIKDGFMFFSKSLKGI